MNSRHRSLPRRDFLQIGALGATGLALPLLLRNQAAAAGPTGFVKDKSVIFLFLAGGPSQYETFDPKQSCPRDLAAQPARCRQVCRG